MNETLKMLSTIIDPTDVERSLEDASAEYKKTLSPCILASAFNNTFKFIISISTNYQSLSSEDVASLSLQCLDLALLQYDDSLSTKFITYFGGVLKAEFRSEQQRRNTQKRKANYIACSYDQMLEDGFDVSVDAVDCTFEDLISISEMSDRDRKYCLLYDAGYSNSEIADILNISVRTIFNIRKNLREVFA